MSAEDETAPSFRTRKTKRSTDKLWVMGLKSNEFVKCGDSFHVVGTAQIPFQPEGFIIPVAIADRFIIDSIIIGNRLALQVSGEAIPGDVFKVRIEDLDSFDVLLSPDSTRIVCVEVGKPLELLNGRSWAFPVMHPGTHIGIRGANVSGTPTVFRGALVGTVPRSTEY